MTKVDEITQLMMTRMVPAMGWKHVRGHVEITNQVAADDLVVVFDLLALAPKKASTASRLSRLLSPLFSHSGILKLGFGLQQPGFSCFAVTDTCCTS